MRCERCGQDSEAGNRFCPWCGAALPVGGPPCSACGRPGVPGDVFCTYCAASLMPDEPPPEALVRSKAFGEPVPFEVRVVAVAGLQAYPEPGSPSGAAAERRLTLGQSVILRRRDGDWAFVWAEDGWMGWVPEAGLREPDG